MIHPTDQQELQATVDRHLVDAVLLQATVYADRVADSVEVQATISPLMTDAVQLRATVLNTELAAAAAGRVLAPAIEVTFAVS